jgi:molecular chaperone DnaK
MGKYVGIDLGTTNSVVAVVGEYPSYPRFGRVTILPDSIGRTIHASAICDCNGELVFGDDAKYKAAEGAYAPIRFWKRYMGTGNTFDLKGRPHQPQELSKLLLDYLKDVASKALGQPVDGAVIAHPAYFGGSAIAATREAGDAAGLNVGDHGLVMEPIAAALAYLQDDPDPSKKVRVLVYDFGGGTFDVTILQRDSGAFTPLSFDGDAELGGYNIDNVVADHILAELRKQGYRITIDPNAPEKDRRWAQLLHIAEEVKINLSRPGQRGLKADLSEPRLFNDEDGKAVRLALSITRKQFEEWVSPLVERTIVCCHSAIEKAKITDLATIDRLILVGGSSRLPIVQRRLAEVFGREFEFDGQMVDLYVAIGAALFAAPAGVQVVGFQLEPIAERTSAPDVVVAGRLKPNETVPQLKGCLVALTHDGQSEPQVTDEEGNFYFTPSLTAGAANEFVLTAQTPDKREFARHAFTILQDSQAPPEPPPPPWSSYLAKSLYVNTANRGMVMIAQEGQPLPMDIEVNWLETSGQNNPEVRVEVHQEDQLLATFPLIPSTAPVPQGTPVKLTVHVNKDYSMSARAEIPSHNIVNEDKIQIPKPTRPKVGDLQAWHHRLQGEFKELLEGLPSGEAKMDFGAEGEAVLEEVGELLQHTEADVYRIERLLRNLEEKMKREIGSMKPTPAEMQNQFGKARDLLPQAEAKDPNLKKQGYRQTLDDLSARADEAYAKRNQRDWEKIAKRVEEAIKTFEGVIGGGGHFELPPAPTLLLMVQGWTADLEQTASANGRIKDPAVQEAMRKVHQELDKVDTSAPDAQSVLVGIVRGPWNRLEQLIKGDKRPPPPIDGLVNASRS